MDSEKYEEATYFAKKIDWDAVTYPKRYSYLLNPKLPLYE